MDNINPKITIVTVTYNAQNFLEETILSIINQDYKNIEYIIIDGESTDKTVDIIKKYENHIDYWISEEDSGIYDAMNKGIDKATGSWINFMNAGDSFFKNSSITQAFELCEKETHILIGNTNYIKNNFSTIKKPFSLDRKLDFMFCYHQSLFTKTSLMKKFKFNNDFSIAADYNFILKCCINNYKLQFIDHTIANFISGGFAETNPIKSVIETMFVQSQYLKDTKDIYSKISFNILERQKENNNFMLKTLLNKLILEIERLKLKEKKLIFMDLEM